MPTDAPPTGVQIFDTWESLDRRNARHGRVDMATGALSYIAVFKTAPRRGEPTFHQHPDSDQILFVLDGECTARSLDGEEVLKPNDGVLIPAGSYYGFANTGEGDMYFLSMRTESSGGRYIGYAPDSPSGVRVNISEEMFSAKPEKDDLVVYVIDHKTMGISPSLIQEWNKSCLLRGSAPYKREDGRFVVELPQRIADWYEIKTLSDQEYQVHKVSGGEGVQIELA